LYAEVRRLVIDAIRHLPDVGPTGLNSTHKTLVIGPFESYLSNRVLHESLQSKAGPVVQVTTSVKGPAHAPFVVEITLNVDKPKEDSGKEEESKKNSKPKKKATQLPHIGYEVHVNGDRVAIGHAFVTDPGAEKIRIGRQGNVDLLDEYPRVADDPKFDECSTCKFYRYNF
jgi:hypothetical protein